MGAFLARGETKMTKNPGCTNPGIPPAADSTAAKWKRQSLQKKKRKRSQGSPPPRRQPQTESKRKKGGKKKTKAETMKETKAETMKETKAETKTRMKRTSTGRDVDSLREGAGGGCGGEERQRRRY
jgi:hypothetical protein